MLEAQFEREDSIALFKKFFGTELTAELLDKYGFTLSADLRSRAIRSMKLADMTLGDLAAMQSEGQVSAPRTLPPLKLPKIIPPRRV